MYIFSPKVAYAATPELDAFIGTVNRVILNPLITLLFALAIVIFLWGMFEFILNQQSGEKKTDGKAHMLWGIVGITIMMSVWTILGIIMKTLNITGINPEQGTVNLK